MERMNSTSFQGLEKPENFWYKEEEEVQRDSRLVKACKRLLERLGIIEFKMQNKALLL